MLDKGKGGPRKAPSAGPSGQEGGGGRRRGREGEARAEPREGELVAVGGRRTGDRRQGRAGRRTRASRRTGGPRRAGCERGASVSLAVLALALAVAAGCSAQVGAPIRRRARIDALEAHFSRLPPARALAIAGDPAGLFVAGYASGRASLAEARALALSRCEERRRDRRVAAPCTLRRAIARPGSEAGEGG